MQKTKQFWRPKWKDEEYNRKVEWIKKILNNLKDMKKTLRWTYILTQTPQKVINWKHLDKIVSTNLKSSRLSEINSNSATEFIYLGCANEASNWQNNKK